MRPSPILARAGMLAALLAVYPLAGATVGRSQARTLATGTTNAQTTASDSLTRTDAITRLQARIDSGLEAFPFDSARGYLPALLRALRIPVSSQSLVFSRTSLQTDLIAPWSPRAVYFNDDVYIGFVPESNLLEVAAVSATMGAVFYTLNQDSHSHPTFKHETTSCLMCHKSPASTLGVAGFTMLSTLADSDGYAIASVHTGATTDATPIEKRFGGWYVTGTVGTSTHSGNVRSPMKYADIKNTEDYRKSFDFTGDSKRMELKDKVSMERYLANYSDVVALMVLVHQTSVHNLITVVHFAATQALKEDAIVRGYLSDTSGAQSLEATNPRLRVAVDNLARAMLFIDEAPLSGAIRGTSGFVKDFESVGRRDAHGRSLRDFDLQRRMFKYPLSFLIYSEAFDELPVEARNAVYRRLRAILQGEDPNSEYARLSQADRTAITEILTSTKPEFARSGW